MKFDKARCIPLILSGAVLFVDQISKFIIEFFWPFNNSQPWLYSSSSPIAQVFGNDFLQIIHVRNPAIAFSIGRGWAEPYKSIIVIAIPILVVGVLLWYYFRSNDFTRLQRWATAAIIGGGLGNMIDRIFRSDGVIDFIDFKFYGIFGFVRWPTFNIADSCVVIGSITLLVSIIFFSPKRLKKKVK